MKRIAFIVLSLMVLLLAGCGEKTPAEKEISINQDQNKEQNSTDNTSGTETSQIEEEKDSAVSAVEKNGLEKIQKLANSASEGKISSVDVLHTAREILEEEAESDWENFEDMEAVSNSIEGPVNHPEQPPKSKLETVIAQIASIISTVPGDKLENLAYLLNLDTKQIIDAESKQNKLDLLFIELGKSHITVIESKCDTGTDDDKAKCKEDLLKEQKLANTFDRFVLHYLVKTNIQFLSGTTSGLSYDKVIEYYRTRVEANRGITKARKIFQEFALLGEILPDRFLRTVFAPVLPQQWIKKHNPKIVQLNFSKILKETNQLDPAKREVMRGTAFLTRSALKNGLWAINELGKEEARYKDLVLYFGILDQINALFDNGIKFNKIPSRQWVKQLDSRTNKLMYAFKNAVKKLIRQGVTITSNDFSNLHPYTEIYLSRALIEMGKLVKLSARSFDEFWNNAVDRINTLNRSANINANHDKAKYHKHFYEVEFSKFYIDASKYINGEGVKANTSEIDLYQKKTFPALVEALNIRFNKKYSVSDFQEKSPETNLYDLEHEFTKSNKGITVKDKGIIVKDYCEGKSLPSCDEKKFTAGIYRTKGDLEIRGNSIRFTPLAMIYNPSKEVILHFNKVIDAWIDTSGRYKKAKSRERPGRDFHCKKNNDTGPGYHGIDGEIAGAITLSTRQMDGLQFLISVGGDGSDGTEGIPSSYQCSSYIPYIKKKGGDGGNAGDGRAPKLIGIASEYMNQITQIIAPGRPGKGGSCAFSNLSTYMGTKGTEGSIVR